ncbi:hypothetical protein PtB15_12B116 [Puccinia triticina]|nr:hypothetical protein PtB15_12B116 [Puccinia triticina]
MLAGQESCGFFRCRSGYRGAGQLGCEIPPDRWTNPGNRRPFAPTWRPLGDLSTGNRRRPDALDTQKAHLVQLQTASLPALIRQLEDLLGSLDLAHLVPLRDTLEITSRLSNTLSPSIRALSPVAANRYHQAQDHDHRYGSLKQYRVHQLIAKAILLMCNCVSPLFHKHIALMQILQDPASSLLIETSLPAHAKIVVEATAECCDELSSLLRRSMKSDFGIRGVPSARNTAWILLGPARRSDPIARPIGRRRRLAKLELAQPLPAAYTHPSPRLRTSEERLFSRERLSPSEAAITIIKLLRILFTKRSDARANTPPFTSGTALSSADFKAIDHELHALHSRLEALLNTLYFMYHENHTAAYLGRESLDDISSHFDSYYSVISIPWLLKPAILLSPEPGPNLGSMHQAHKPARPLDTSDTLYTSVECGDCSHCMSRGPAGDASRPSLAGQPRGRPGTPGRTAKSAIERTPVLAAPRAADSYSPLAIKVHRLPDHPVGCSAVLSPSQSDLAR